MGMEHNHMRSTQVLCRRRSPRIWVPCSVVILASLASTEPAFAIDAAGFKRVMAGLTQCERTQTGAAVNVCVADKIDGAGFKLVESGPLVPQTVADVRVAPTKAAAISVLNRARSVMQSLSTKTSGFAQESYGRMNQIYARAIDVINRKG